jgi:hypothetical protein
MIFDFDLVIAIKLSLASTFAVKIVERSCAIFIHYVYLLDDFYYTYENRDTTKHHREQVMDKHP